MPTRAGIGDGAAADDVVAVHFPHRNLPTAGILHQDVGMTVVIEIACADGVPTRPGIGDGPAAHDFVAVHFPDRGLAVRVLKKNVGTIAAGSDGVPTRPAIGADWPAANQNYLPD